MDIEQLQQTSNIQSLEELLYNASDGLFLIDRHRRFVLFNKACERLTGFKQTDVIGQSCRCGETVKCRDDYGRPLWGGLCPALAIFEGHTDVARQRMQITPGRLRAIYRCKASEALVS